MLLADQVHDVPNYLDTGQLIVGLVGLGVSVVGGVLLLMASNESGVMG